MSHAAASTIRRNTGAFRRMSLALFLAGFSTFSLLYCVQPLLPEFADHFKVTPAESSLALSLSTGALAVAIVAASALSQAIGRRGLMFASMGLAALCNLGTAVASDWSTVLALRTLEGLALGGVPAVAMAYLAEEMEPADLAGAMGLYLAGTAFGAMAGRVGMGLLSEWGGSWRVAMGSIGLLDLIAAVGFVALLPRSRNFVRQAGFSPGYHLAAWKRHFQNRELLLLYGAGFCLTAVFVTLFNYVGFRLRAAPYALTQGQASLIFLTFSVGMISSSVAGRLSHRFNARILLRTGFGLMAVGVLLTVTSPLLLLVAGIGLVTMGFFLAHAVASGWVGRRARGAKGHAAALYLLFYYLGSSLVGSVGGWFWQHANWAGVASLAGLLSLIGMLLSQALSSQAPGAFGR
ncbi:MFS transporter [Brevundimonas sp.]|uniref:MFS transporter n=1 Tax=Brevundimonas sp. TaxID=1871086 RepID=UPI0028A67364|nr:MFS transporter [Brevundimonas sp.]